MPSSAAARFSASHAAHWTMRGLSLTLAVRTAKFARWKSSLSGSAVLSIVLSNSILSSRKRSDRIASQATQDFLSRVRSLGQDERVPRPHENDASSDERSNSG